MCAAFFIVKFNSNSQQFKLTTESQLIKILQKPPNRIVNDSLSGDVEDVI